MENDKIRLFAANGKQKTEVGFPWSANDKWLSTCPSTVRYYVLYRVSYVEARPAYLERVLGEVQAGWGQHILLLHLLLALHHHLS
jgi:hypothetical protein